METLPTSRPSVPESGPIPLFDFQLKVLADSYLSFFQERKKIEEIYVDSLTKLHRRIKNVDVTLDDRNELSTTRKAWNEVRDNIERGGSVDVSSDVLSLPSPNSTEAQTRQAFLATLTIDVVQPLTTLKESQDRTRKRIKDDLKISSVAYNDYAENVLPRLKRTYLKKCQDVEDHKTAASTPLQPPTVTSDIQSGLNPKSQFVTPSRPVVTSPQPLRPVERRPPTFVPPPRNRSPSASTPFSDFAHQGKRQLNQLIGFLDKGGAKDGLGGRSADSGLRAVRAKREADEADREYRRAVHWLETLRLRRTKILEGAYKSLELFIQESAATLKELLEKYTDNMTATTTTQTQLSGYARKAVEQISPQKDVSKLTSSLPRSLASATPKPILYYNYHVGECRDLIFGVSLVDYATARGIADGDVPKIVRICTKEIDQRGLDSEGIYRVSGRHAIVQSLQHKIERNEREFEFKPLTDDVYAVSSLLKLYLRELPEPVFRFPLQDRLQHTEDLAEHVSNNFALLRGKIRRLPAVHQATLKAILEHLFRVVSNERNKMDAKNLAIAFGGVIFGEDEMPKGDDSLLGMTACKDTLMEDLIHNVQILFDESTTNNSPPLPPTPVGEPVPSFVYGTSHTKVTSVLPGPSTSHSVAEDFAPPLPPRPANSIHPSLRANPMSPNKEDVPLPPIQPHDDDMQSAQTTLVDVEEEDTDYQSAESSPSEDAASQHSRSLSSPKSPRTSLNSSTVQSEASTSQLETSHPPPLAG